MANFALVCSLVLLASPQVEGEFHSCISHVFFYLLCLCAKCIFKLSLFNARSTMQDDITYFHGCQQNVSSSKSKLVLADDLFGTAL